MIDWLSALPPSAILAALMTVPGIVILICLYADPQTGNDGWEP
jgi:hypothetical protein